MLTPLDIQSVTFSRSMRGYNEREVDDFLDRLVIEYEQLYKENLALKEKLAALTAQSAPGGPGGLDPAQVDETVQRIIALGEEAAREAKANAEQAAALIIEQARAQSEKLSRAVREDVQKELTRLEEVRKQAQLFRIQFRTLLETYIQLLDSSAEMGSNREAGAAGGAGGLVAGFGTGPATGLAAGQAGKVSPATAVSREPVESSAIPGGTQLTPGEKRALLNIIAPEHNSAGGGIAGGAVGKAAGGVIDRMDGGSSGRFAEGLKEAAAGLDAAGGSGAGQAAANLDVGGQYAASHAAGQAVPDFDEDEQTPTWMEVRK